MGLKGCRYGTCAKGTRYGEQVRQDQRSQTRTRNRKIAIENDRGRRDLHRMVPVGGRRVGEGSQTRGGTMVVPSLAIERPTEKRKIAIFLPAVQDLRLIV